jgi:hypothetical protein
VYAFEGVVRAIRREGNFTKLNSPSLSSVRVTCEGRNYKEEEKEEEKMV